MIVLQGRLCVCVLAEIAASRSHEIVRVNSQKQRDETPEKTLGPGCFPKLEREGVFALLRWKQVRQSWMMGVRGWRLAAEDARGDE